MDCVDHCCVGWYAEPDRFPSGAGTQRSLQTRGSVFPVVRGTSFTSAAKNMRQPSPWSRRSFLS